MEVHHHNMKKTSQRGFTLLLAALVSSIVLGLGASIFLIAKKEVTLSSLGRDSQYAFYAADQAAECALYWDLRRNYFGTTTPSNLLPPSDPTCDSQHWNPAGGTLGGSRPAYPYSVTFEYAPVSVGSSYCARVIVYKCDGTITNTNGTFSCASAVPAVVHTTIHADGYSTSCGTIGTSPRTLQRSVELHY